jgi:hypothetical protein
VAGAFALFREGFPGAVSLCRPNCYNLQKFCNNSVANPTYIGYNKEVKMDLSGRYASGDADFETGGGAAGEKSGGA